MPSPGNTKPLGILPQASFMKKVDAAQLRDFHYDDRVRVNSRAAFLAMQDHLHVIYDGVDVAHSFEDASGLVFDCVPIEQQPGLQATRGRRLTPPDMRWASRMSGPGGIDLYAPAAPDFVNLDRHGNVRKAPPGCIPMRRLSLEEMTR